MSTYRERREAQVDRLEGWADKREAKADAAYEGVRQIADMIPFGQPILVGHHSEGRARRDAERMDSGMRRSVENADKAARMREKAKNIAAAAEVAIYSDDPDAIERLEEKLADLLAQRAAITAYNKTARKGTPDFSLLPDNRLRRRAMEGAAVGNPSMPAYVAANLGGVISTTRKRLEGLRRRAEIASRKEATE